MANKTTKKVEKNVAVEEKVTIWILTARKKDKTKQVINFVCNGNDAVDKAVADLKENGLTFITLTTEERVRAYLEGKEPAKGWATNVNALKSRKVELEGLYDAEIQYLNDHGPTVLFKASDIVVCPKPKDEELVEE